jgi:hypothetical protein
MPSRDAFGVAVVEVTMRSGTDRRQRQRQKAWVLIARRIRGISACGAVVVRSRYCGTDRGSAYRGSASAYAPTTARIGSTISPAVISAMVACDASAAMEASDASAAAESAAAG